MHRRVDIDSLRARHDNLAEMSEHGFLAAMLALVGLEVVALGYFTYRITRILERIEGVGAATFLEVRKVLGQSR